MMKKQLMMVAAIVLTALCMQSCLARLTKDVKKIEKELEEVTAGDIFQIPAATVIYSDGVTFAFKENGRYQYIEDKYDIRITTPTKQYECNKSSKTYYVIDYDSERYGYTSEYVVFEAALEAETYWDKYDEDSNLSKKSMTICGKTCKAFVDEDGDVVASWNRLQMYDKDYDDTEEVKATSLVEKADDALFSVPAGYTEDIY